MVPLPRVLLAALGLASEVMGHGAIWYSEADGVQLAGYFSRTKGHPDENDHSLGNNWLTPEQLKDYGFIRPEQYNTPDVICHVGATNAPGYLTVKAGDEVTLKWTNWPNSHHGPMIDYLSNCNGDCTTVDKTTLKFNKIAESGLLDPEHKLFDAKFTQTSGYWASDKFREANDTWTVKIPPTIAPGSYLLRQETIALHSSMKEIVNGTQNYPQCFNLKITGSGTDNLSGGTPGMELYTGLEPGLHELNIFENNGGLRNYTIPGPPLHDYDGSAPAPATSGISASPSAHASPSPAKYQNSTSPAIPKSTSESPISTPTTAVSNTLPDTGASANATPAVAPSGTVTITTTIKGLAAACPTNTGTGNSDLVEVNRSDLNAFLTAFEKATEKFMLIMEEIPPAKRSVIEKRYAKDMEMNLRD